MYRPETPLSAINNDISYAQSMRVDEGNNGVKCFRDNKIKPRTVEGRWEKKRLLCYEQEGERKEGRR